MTAVEHLRKVEWTMGNGQCGTCYGLGVSFHKSRGASQIGHEKECGLAGALASLGEKPLYKGEFDPGYDFESYWNDDGLMCSRLKCYPPPPETKKQKCRRESQQRDWAKILNDAFEKTIMREVVG